MDRGKDKGMGKRTEKKATRKNGEKPEKNRGKCERAEGKRTRKWKREKRARRETGNKLMKELVTLMCVNPLPLFYTTGTRRVLCV